MRDDYLAKWLNDELTAEELRDFKNSEEYASYLKLKEASARLEAPEFDQERAWSRLRDRQQHRSAKVVRMRPVRLWMRVAAAIALIFTITYFYINSLDETISTRYAQRESVVLPDASEVILNAGSEISYSEKKWDQERTIRLEGEAFFKVAKGKKFTVTTETGTVTVLGTQFNVEQRSGYFEVSCYEGLVSVQYGEMNTELPAGSSLIAYNGTVLESEVAKNQSPSWLNNESTFKSIPLKFVLNELERQFNVEVVTRDIDTIQLFTGTFSNTNLNLALESISAPYQINYKLEGKQVLFYAGDSP